MTDTTATRIVLSEPWAIQPEALETIIQIANRTNESPEAVAAKLGRPLENTQRAAIRGTTAVIPVHGPIFRRANLFTQISGATSLEILARDFHEAQANDKVDRIVLDLSSPGGQAAGISEFAGMVRDSRKPVTAYVGDVAASAAYWIAAAAKEIVVADTAILGSIGVVSSFRPGNANEIKIVSSQSPVKQADPATEVGRAEVQRVVDDLAAVFINHVAKYRGVSSKTVMSDFGKGGVLVGEKAVTAGMADRIGAFESLFTTSTTTPHTTTIGASTMSTQPQTIETLEKAVVGMDATAVEQLVAAEWPNNPALRAEFSEQETATAYLQVIASRNLRQVGKTVTGTVVG